MNEVRDMANNFDFNGIPDELKAVQQWICWRFGPLETGSKKRRKLPINPKTNKPCDYTDPIIWASFSDAQAAWLISKNPKLDGLGFVFTENDPYCGVDFDTCRNIDTGELYEEVQRHVTALASYTEVSVSKTGIHIICKAKMPSAVVDHPSGIEVYGQGRYFVFTGDHVPGTPKKVNDAQAYIDRLYKTHKEQTGPIGAKEIKRLWGGQENLFTPDNEILAEALRSDRFKRLYNGDMSDIKPGTPDADKLSESDLALCGQLAKLTRNPWQIERLWEKSKLASREKFDRDDYRQRTIGKAIINAPLLGVAADNVVQKPVHWLWNGYIPLGHMGLFDGDPGLGKSIITVDFAARISTGAPFPNDAAKREPAGAIIMSGEDSLSDTIAPRLSAAGADLSRIRIIQGMSAGKTLTIPDDLDALELVVQEYRALFIVLDPINVFLSEDIDSHNDQSMRRALGPLCRFAERTGTFILLIRHWSKMGGVKPIYRGGGSIAYTAAARVGFQAAVDSTTGKKLFSPMKENLAPRAMSIEYKITEKKSELTKTSLPYIEWGLPSSLTAEDIVERENKNKGEGQRGKAIQFLLDALENGPQPVKDLEEKAKKEHNISEPTLNRARKELKIKAIKMKGVWCMSLPVEESKELFDKGGL